jgi:hypothetical protein
MKELLEGIVSMIFLGVKGRDSRIGSSLRRGCAGVQPCNTTAHLPIQQTSRIENNRPNLHIPGLDKAVLNKVSLKKSQKSPFRIHKNTIALFNECEPSNNL